MQRGVSCSVSSLSGGRRCWPRHCIAAWVARGYKEIYKIKRRDTALSLTFTSVINISPSFLFQVSFQREKDRESGWERKVQPDAAGVESLHSIVSTTPPLSSPLAQSISALWAPFDVLFHGSITVRWWDHLLFHVNIYGGEYWFVSVI